MADEFDTPVDELVPAVDDDAVDELEDLEATEDALEDEDAVLSLEPAAATVGRSWAWDARSGRLILNGHSPATTNGDNTLRYWIEKCLLTPEGGSVIHPAGYGMRVPITSLIASNPNLERAGELELEIEQALTFHPAIDGIEDFSAQIDDADGEAQLYVSFTVMKRGGGLLRLSANARGVNVAADAGLEF